MKFLVPNYSRIQNPWLGGYRPQIPVLSVLFPQPNLLKPPRTKFLGMSLLGAYKYSLLSFKITLQNRASFIDNKTETVKYKTIPKGKYKIHTNCIFLCNDIPF